MILTDLTHHDLDEAVALAKANYADERRHVPSLPLVAALPEMAHFAENGLGVAAFEQGAMLGFLGCYGPWENVFGNAGVKGVFSPIYAHGAVAEKSGMIYRRLYQAAAEKWVGQGVASHALGLYAHNIQAIQTFFAYGFGLRSIDAIRAMETIPDIPSIIPSGESEYCEVGKESIESITPLRRMLAEHLMKSPTFVVMKPQDVEAWLQRAATRDSRLFVAKVQEQIVAYIEVIDDADTFVSEDGSVKNICGAFCLDEHRGNGTAQHLLNFTIATLKQEGFLCLGVDFESFNPTAYGFWMKYFTPYTNNVVRRIDGSF